MGQKKREKLWSAEKRFETVLLTAPMSEAEKSEFCRKHGLYSESLFKTLKYIPIYLSKPFDTIEIAGEDVIP